MSLVSAKARAAACLEKRKISSLAVHSNHQKTAEKVFYLPVPSAVTLQHCSLSPASEPSPSSGFNSIDKQDL